MCADRHKTQPTHARPTALRSHMGMLVICPLFISQRELWPSHQRPTRRTACLGQTNAPWHLLLRIPKKTSSHHLSRRRSGSSPSRYAVSWPGEQCPTCGLQWNGTQRTQHTNLPFNASTSFGRCLFLVSPCPSCPRVPSPHVHTGRSPCLHALARRPLPFVLLTYPYVMLCTH